MKGDVMRNKMPPQITNRFEAGENPCDRCRWLDEVEDDEFPCSECIHNLKTAPSPIP